MPTATFTTPGANSWTCPAGVTSIQVECQSGGSGGDINTVGGGGGGGGGGGYVINTTVAVTPTTVYNPFVGAGGAAGSGSGSVAGGTSSFAGDSVTVSINGAGAANGLNGGIGATTGANYTTLYTGGNGATGTTPANPGGGGAAGGAGGNGGAGSTPSGGVSAGGSPAGGGGGAGSTLSMGNPGAQPGGGGGGGTAVGLSGAGANGQVILTWTTPANTPSIPLTVVAQPSEIPTNPPAIVRVGGPFPPSPVPSPRPMVTAYDPFNWSTGPITTATAGGPLPPPPYNAPVVGIIPQPVPTPSNPSAIVLTGRSDPPAGGSRPAPSNVIRYDPFDWFPTPISIRSPWAPLPSQMPIAPVVVRYDTPPDQVLTPIVLRRTPTPQGPARPVIVAQPSEVAGNPPSVVLRAPFGYPALPLARTTQVIPQPPEGFWWPPVTSLTNRPNDRVGAARNTVVIPQLPDVTPNPAAISLRAPFGNPPIPISSVTIRVVGQAPEPVWSPSPVTLSGRSAAVAPVESLVVPSVWPVDVSSAAVTLWSKGAQPPRSTTFITQVVGELPTIPNVSVVLAGRDRNASRPRPNVVTVPAALESPVAPVTWQPRYDLSQPAKRPTIAPYYPFVWQPQPITLTTQWNPIPHAPRLTIVAQPEAVYWFPGPILSVGRWDAGGQPVGPTTGVVVTIPGTDTSVFTLTSLCPCEIEYPL